MVDETNETQKKKSIEELEKWSDECEALLAEWSEKASCYRWLHGRSEKSYRTWYYCFSIPVIILSTLTGAANVGMDSFVPEESKSIASAIVGGVNIFAGIISTLQNFLKVAELMEAHRIAGVSWGKLQRNIAIELALDPSRRIIQTDFLKMSRSEYDRLLEAGPIIDDGIIKQFNKKFKNYGVAVPSICNGLDRCNVYKIDKTIKPNEKEFTEGIEDIISNEEKNISNTTEIIIKKNDDIKIDKNNLSNDINLDNKKSDDLNEDKSNEDKIETENLIPNNDNCKCKEKNDKEEEDEKEENVIDENNTETSEDLNNIKDDFLEGIDKQ